jgi:hypothetical protein
VEFTKDGDSVSVTLMNCREYENKYRPWIGIGYEEISKERAFCCQVEVNTISDSGRLCIPWTNGDRTSTDFKVSQFNLCGFFGCGDQFSVRPGDPNLDGGGDVYTDEFGDTFTILILLAVLVLLIGDIATLVNTTLIQPNASIGILKEIYYVVMILTGDRPRAI